MDIKSLLEEYAVIMDDMEAESGLNTVMEPEKEEKKEDKKEDKKDKNESLESVNEEKDLAETPADMEKAEYKDMKIKEPEVDDQPIAKKLLKQCEEITEEKIDEISLETAQKVNDIRNKDAVLNQDDEEAQEKAEKSNKLFRKWKKAKGIEEAVESLGELKTKKTNKK